jgi:hypothetical protein
MHLFAILSLLLGGAPLAAADRSDFAGTYYASLPERAEILNLHRDGTAEITLSDQVTSGAGGFTFSDSFGSWKIAGPRKLTARFLNLNFEVTGPAAFTGIAVVDYTFQLAPGLHTMSASCNGKIFPTGQDPFSPASTPVTTFDCSYLNGYLYKKMPL